MRSQHVGMHIAEPHADSGAERTICMTRQMARAAPPLSPLPPRGNRSRDADPGRSRSSSCECVGGSANKIKAAKANA